MIYALAAALLAVSTLAQDPDDRPTVGDWVYVIKNRYNRHIGAVGRIWNDARDNQPYQATFDCIDSTFWFFPNEVKKVEAPVDDGCDCQGKWRDCNASCQRIFDIARPKRKEGKECDFNNGQRDDQCNVGDGQCKEAGGEGPVGGGPGAGDDEEPFASKEEFETWCNKGPENCKAAKGKWRKKKGCSVRNKSLKCRNYNKNEANLCSRLPKCDFRVMKNDKTRCKGGRAKWAK